MREAKNQFVQYYLNTLTAQNRMRSTVMCHLRKSHTHCRIGAIKKKFSEFTFVPDQLWGIISRGVMNQSHLQDPEDAMAAIRAELTKPTIKDWLGSEVKVLVTKMDATLDWRKQIPSLGLKIEGGLLKDESGNHLFLSLLRKGAEVTYTSDMHYTRHFLCEGHYN